MVITEPFLSSSAQVSRCRRRHPIILTIIRSITISITTTIIVVGGGDCGSRPRVVVVAASAALMVAVVGRHCWRSWQCSCRCCAWWKCDLPCAYSACHPSMCDHSEIRQETLEHKRVASEKALYLVRKWFANGMKSSFPSSSKLRSDIIWELGQFLCIHHMKSNKMYCYVT